ncbi:hypothetical protein FGB62_169g06 [Gracilaria domingensis]|nr:hypothetical protein FGB62_169g06 [Gracilaria domingensis]
MIAVVQREVVDAADALVVVEAVCGVLQSAVGVVGVEAQARTGRAEVGEVAGALCNDVGDGAPQVGVDCSGRHALSNKQQIGVVRAAQEAFARHGGRAALGGGARRSEARAQGEQQQGQRRDEAGGHGGRAANERESGQRSEAAAAAAAAAAAGCAGCAGW